MAPQYTDFYEKRIDLTRKKIEILKKHITDCKTDLEIQEETLDRLLANAQQTKTG